MEVAMTEVKALPADFPSTDSGLLGAMREGGEVRRQAEKEFTRRYNDPVFYYLRGWLRKYTRNDQDAGDLTNGFLVTKIYAGKLLDHYDTDKGPFRPYIKRSLSNYAVESLRRMPRHEVLVGDQAFVEPPDAERAFHDHCIIRMVKEANGLTLQKCVAKGLDRAYKLFHGFYIAPLAEVDERPSWRDLAAQVGPDEASKKQMDEKDTRKQAQKAVRIFGEMFFALAVRETGSEEAARKEFDFLRSAASPNLDHFLNFVLADQNGQSGFAHLS